MTEEDFELIAKIIRNLDLSGWSRHGDEELRAEISAQFARELWATNPKLKTGKFAVACSDPPDK